MALKWGSLGRAEVQAAQPRSIAFSAQCIQDESNLAVPQINYITGFGNLPGFVPVQEEPTPDNPPLQVIYVPANQQRIVYPAPIAPPPPSLAGTSQKA